MINYMKIDVDRKIDIDRKIEEEKKDSIEGKKKMKKKKRENIDRFDIGPRQIVYSYIEKVCNNR